MELCPSVYGHVNIDGKSLNQHDNHRGICGPVSRKMPVNILSRASNIWRMYTMTTHSVRTMAAALACTALVVACGSAKAPSKDCIEAARLFAEAVDQDSHAPDNEKAKDMTGRKEALAALEERKERLCK